MPCRKQPLSTPYAILAPVSGKRVPRSKPSLRKFRCLSYHLSLENSTDSSTSLLGHRGERFAIIELKWCHVIVAVALKRLSQSRATTESFGLRKRDQQLRPTICWSREARENKCSTPDKSGNRKLEIRTRTSLRVNRRQALTAFTSCGV